ncbi:MAG: phosphatidylserine decarboxylase [Planctomycetota bacterium]|jgi:phosphatidylserine decarboxylase
MMRIPLTKYGWPQVFVFPLIVFAVMVIFPPVVPALGGLPLWAVLLVEVILASICILIFAFFRDPYRDPPSDTNLLLAPADGRVTDIEIVDEDNFIGGPALRVGIFLSIFSTHINRAPCNVKVEKITYRKGQYKNAANLQSGRVNESNNLDLVRTDGPQQRLIVRQISGAIARRIVCNVSEGQVLTGGEKFGMIKFGSRTELYVPSGENAKCLVRIGDKVKAGLTTLVRYEDV